MPKALITGIAGQDGYYLAELLNAQGVEVWGATRTGTCPPDLPFARPTPAIDLRDRASLDRAIEMARPDEVYHLAGQSSVARSWEHPIETGDINALGTNRVLDAVRHHAPAARVFVASSSEIFGEADRAPQNESTPFQPVSPYGIAKAFATQTANAYRRQYGLFVAVGVLYNHESPRRGLEFVTRKITYAVARIKHGLQTELRLGNLEARRDWGYAGDYVRAMHLMLQRDDPSDYVVATGETHTVRDFCDLAFQAAGLDYRPYVVTDPRFYRPAESVPLVGDSTKARSELGWSPSVSFAQLVQMLVDAEISHILTES